jgi:hypothetical protein
MKRLTACLGAGAMFVALLTAPLFHFHDRDDHGSPVSLVHAHFLGSPESGHHSDNAVESRHSHDKARWVEFFTFSGPQSGFDWAVGSIETLTVSTTEVRQGISILTVPRSHGPPGARPSIPRSPPTA